MTFVQTAVGLVERDRLEVADIVTDEPNARVVATEWRLDGEIVRRDVAVSMLQGLSLNGEQAEF